MRIVVGGQIDKENVAKILKEEFSDAQIDIKSDIDAAMEMKLGNYDYYFGACNTGGGGALAMAIAILGANICLTVASPGTILTDEEVEKEIKSGKKAFGFTPNAAEKSIKMIKKYL
jgi:putative inner membrane protein